MPIKSGKLIVVVSSIACTDNLKCNHTLILFNCIPGRRIPTQKYLLLPTHKNTIYVD